MNDTIPATGADAATGGCCTPTGTADAADAAVTGGPCCGSADAATQAGACCDPAAKAEALDAGAGCCGPRPDAADTATATTPSLATIGDGPARWTEPAALGSTDAGAPPVVVIGGGPGPGLGTPWTGECPVCTSVDRASGTGASGRPIMLHPAGSRCWNASTLHVPC
jgi:hypothetical protein